MNRVTTIITITVLASSAYLSQAQVADSSVSGPVDELQHLFEDDTPSFKERWSLNEPNNELQLSVYAMFFVYKEFVSSQDNSVCNFYPSCSVYAIHSIQKKGAIIGIMSAFDRLMRCNGLNPEDYTIHPSTRLLYDPVD